MFEKNLKIIIFTEFSKNVGLGHYVRSKRLYNYLKDKFQISFYFNKNKIFINKFIQNVKSKTIFIFDFKNYKTHQYKINNQSFHLYFDRKIKKRKNCLSINPLCPSQSYFSGPKWFFYPSNFFKFRKVKKNNKIKKILICQGGTDANNNIVKLIKIIKNEINNIKFELNILAPKFYKISKFLKKKYSIKIYSNIKNFSHFINKFDHIVTACGNISYEINFFGLSCTYVSSEPREIKLAKYLEKNKFGRYFKISEKNQIINDVYSHLKVEQLKKRYINKIKYFRHNGLDNILKLILRIKNEI
jgi:spore coat polysaccharide biosynthesis predicted glycosyltransferase SpsG